MPKGYVCDKCAKFSEYTHHMSQLDLQLLHPAGSTISKTYTVCPDCSELVESLMEEKE